jgi:defect in organelle trafficking protein DotD
MNLKKVILTVVPLIILQLVGCSSEPRIAASASAQRSRAADVQLAQAADSVSQSLGELAAIERASHPRTMIQSPTEPDMIGMGQLASLDWSGPIGPLVKKIAEATNYRYKVLGTAPTVPILVSISAKDIPLGDILRDAGFQCGEKANIVVYPASKIIELRYTKP